MLVRIVKLSFRESEINHFKAHFDTIKNRVRNYEGCCFLELYQDQDTPNIFFTYSYWESQQHLTDYLNSAVFTSIWEQTKPLFNDRPQAWSVNKIHSLA